jgi:2-polyprenyl-6-hydroxyphenyl methylase/3-demethylubiquinone-9 3-methyltransferase
MGTDAGAEVNAGQRFAFGANWARFLKSMSEERIDVAIKSLQIMLGSDRLDRCSFLDAGSGSGLFSLAARRLGANVISFDFDRQSVACTAELKRLYSPDDSHWRIEQGSVLDSTYLQALGQFDVVYSWGVLHHTGAMWQALENAAPLVRGGGSLFIAIYNDEGYKSRRWTRIKRRYNETKWLRPFLLTYGLLHAWALPTAIDFYHLRPFSSWRHYVKERGMSPWRDVVDWIGGWPFEVATPEAIFDFLRDRGFVLQRLVTRQGLGCNEFVFIKQE